MLHKFEVTGVHTTVDDKLQKYITKKLGGLDKYISKSDRASAHMEVWMKEAKMDGKKQYICEVTIHLPKETINVKEATVNLYAAVDIVQTKLKQQIKKHKEMHRGGAVRRRVFNRFRRATL